jgi:RNA polymerase sigma-70 factor (ECF subfamily)
MRESALDAEIAQPGTQHFEIQARAALAAIRRLPPAYRDTLRMRLVDGLNGPEIAARTGLTAASVRVNLHRGLKLLRESLQRRQP